MTRARLGFKRRADGISVLGDLGCIFVSVKLLVDNRSTAHHTNHYATVVGLDHQQTAVLGFFDSSDMVTNVSNNLNTRSAGRMVPSEPISYFPREASGTRQHADCPNGTESPGRCPPPTCRLPAFGSAVWKARAISFRAWNEHGRSR